MKRLFLLPLALFLLHFNLQAQLPPDEIAALEDLAEAFPTLNWTGTDHCYWEGIQCDVNGNIIAIVIDGHDSVDGLLPQSIGSFPNLVRLAITNSNIFNFSSGYATTFGQLDALEIANFDGNQFGYIPDSLASCPNLKEITFSRNRLQNIASWIGKAVWEDERLDLDVLDVSSNNIHDLNIYVRNMLHDTDVEVYLYDNFLSFEDFDEYYYFGYPLGSEVYLLPQNNYSDTLTIYKLPGEYVYMSGELLNSTLYSNTTYQWYLNGEPLTMPSSGFLSFPMEEEMIGTYICEARNDLFPDWVLWRAPIYLNLTEPIGIAGNAMESQVKLYPNPADDYVFVERPPSLKGTTVILYDTKGRVMGHEKLNRKTKLDLNGLPKGLYIAEIKSGEGTIIEKILKK